MNYLTRKPNKRILIIDDELDILEILGFYLNSKGYEPTLVNTPHEAFPKLETMEFFLIITDIAMRDMDGYELINEVKIRKIPSEIAIMTGFGYNPKHTLVKINKEYNYPIFFKPFEFKKPKIKDAVMTAYNHYHSLIPL